MWDNVDAACLLPRVKDIPWLHVFILVFPPIGEVIDYVLGVFKGSNKLL